MQSYDSTTFGLLNTPALCIIAERNADLNRECEETVRLEFYAAAGIQTRSWDKNDQW